MVVGYYSTGLRLKSEVIMMLQKIKDALRVMRDGDK